MLARACRVLALLILGTAASAEVLMVYSVQVGLHAMLGGPGCRNLL
jgi:hypothetical protein